jgi:N6-adenosine-specific RNA methylase IME4
MALPFPNKKYDIILSDPPWLYDGASNKMGAAGKHYDLMTQDQLAALPVRELANKKAALFLWATCPRLHMAIEMIGRWGFHYRGVAYIWIKTRKSDNGIISGQGVRPTFVKPTCELVLVATTNPRGRAWPLLTSSQSQYVFAPRGKHSAKPVEVHERIVELAGDRPRIELFSRRPVEGWEGWGNQYPSVAQ